MPSPSFLPSLRRSSRGGSRQKQPDFVVSCEILSCSPWGSWPGYSETVRVPATVQILQVLSIPSIFTSTVHHPLFVASTRPFLSQPRFH